MELRALLVLILLESLGLEVCETVLELNDLSRAQEVFLTGTAIEILPVGSIEGQGKVWRFKPDKVTSAIRSEFSKITHNL